MNDQSRRIRAFTEREYRDWKKRVLKPPVIWLSEEGQRRMGFVYDAIRAGVKFSYAAGLFHEFDEPDEPLVALNDQTMGFFIGQQIIYSIEVDQIKTEAELQDWIKHLAHKVWCTPQHVSEFIRIASKLVGNQITAN